ncbi:MAG: metal-dependent hydrolase [Luteolibacter sp.]
MDWITQAALGALIGELMMGKRLGKLALAWGALFGVMPELLELFFSPVLDTARELACRRALAHSLPLMALGSWGIAHGLAKLWKREKISKGEAGLFVFAVWSAHVLVDCFSTEGSALLWPLLSKRVTFDFLYRIDFLFTAPLLVTAVWLVFINEQKPKKTRGKKIAPVSKRKKICYWGLGLAAGYALLACGMKFIASSGFDADLARRGTKFSRRMESPTPFNFLLWRSVVDRDVELWVGYRTIFERHDTPVRWTIYPKGADALAKVADLRETKTLTSVTDNWWIARPNIKGAWLGDLRFCETRTWGSRKDAVDSRLAISWLIDTKHDGDHLREIFPNESAPGDLMRMGRRITGDREAWEANPRLAGAEGSLPEFLPVEE